MALHSSPPDVKFDDQFAIHYCSSHHLNYATVKLASNDYVRVFALDFTEAFDTVRHSSLMNKFAKMNLPDAVYNWVKDFFDNREHCTNKFRGEISEAVLTYFPASSRDLD